MCKKRAFIARHPEYKAAEGVRRRAQAKGVSVATYTAWQMERASLAALRRGTVIDGVRVKKNTRRKCPVFKDRRLDYIVHAEQYKAKSREYHACNPIKGRERRHRRRARFIEVFRDLTDAQWREIIRRFDYRCAYCGLKTKLTIDHITPISKGGPHTASNVVPACHKCNTRKRVGPPPRAVQPMLLC